MEEKERNKVNKALPRVEQELEQLIGDWERLHQVSDRVLESRDCSDACSQPNGFNTFPSSRLSSWWGECASRTSSRRRNRSV